MKHNKFSHWAIPILGIIIVAILGWSIGRLVLKNSKPLQAQTGQETGVDITTLENRMGLAFVPVDVTQVEVAIISQDEAIALAKQEKPKVEQASSVSAELGYLGSTPNGVTIYNLKDNHLVWFISFQGVTSYASGEPGTNNTSAVSNEYNVIIDAVTGERLFSLVYQ